MIIQKLCCFQLQTRLGGIPNAQLTRASTDAEIAYFKKSKSSQDRINAKNETISTDITDEEDDIVLKSLKNVGLDISCCWQSTLQQEIGRSPDSQQVQGDQKSCPGSE